MKKSKYLLAAIISLILYPEIAGQISFTAPEMLGKPTDNSVVVNVIPDASIQLYYECGTTSGGPYTIQTPVSSASSGQPHETLITGLSPNTHYYYRMRYSTDGGVSWINRDEHSFWTQRAPGSTFKFTVTSDIHANLNTYYQQAMTNILADQPDFNIDLGDTFNPDYATSQTAVKNTYLAHRDPNYFDKVSHSIPIYLSSGNHENEEGWNFDDTPFSIALGSVQARKAFFPTPIPDGFYSGNTDPLPAIDEVTYGDEYREDYYAWEWGDALFVVIDPFQYTMNLPYSPTAGEGSDDAVTGDQWSWTLGQQQYNWFKQTLENSNARFKFVFSHQMLGGITRAISGVGAGYVRGGAEAAAYFEWGGKNADGTQGFEAHRPGWGGTPIHQIMVANGVSAYFHGHDHQYVYEKRDGIVYQETPSPTMTGSGFSGIYTVGTYSDYETIAIHPNAGHLRITVTPDAATVEYVRSNTTGITHSYTILPSSSPVTYKLSIDADPDNSGTTTPEPGEHTYAENAIVNISAIPASGYIFDHWSGNVADPNSANTTITMTQNQSVTAHFIPKPVKSGDMNYDAAVNSTDALIILSCDVGIDISQFCPANCGDVNLDGVVNSTDALIILSFDAGLSVPFPVGGSSCPENVNPCPGCED